MVERMAAQWAAYRAAGDAMEIAGRARAPSGVAPGTRVLTLDGLIPVEFLGPGDRVVTRSGARRLTTLAAGRAGEGYLRIAAGALGPERPDRGLVVGAATRLLLRFGQPGDGRAALIEAGRLIGGRGVSETRRGGAEGLPAPVPSLQLVFDSSEIYYAEGVEIAAAQA